MRRTLSLALALLLALGCAHAPRLPGTGYRVHGARNIDPPTAWYAIALLAEKCVGKGPIPFDDIDWVLADEAFNPEEEPLLGFAGYDPVTGRYLIVLTSTDPRTVAHELLHLTGLVHPDDDDQIAKCEVAAGR